MQEHVGLSQTESQEEWEPIQNFSRNVYIEKSNKGKICHQTVVYLNMVLTDKQVFDIMYKQLRERKDCNIFFKRKRSFKKPEAYF